jgi:hypothetical protein
VRLEKYERHVLENSAIFVTRTINDAIRLLTNFEFPIWVQPKKFRFLLFVEKLKDEKDLNMLPQIKINKRSQHISHFCYYVIEKKKKVQLYTVDIFREGACGSYDYVEIGSFDKKLKKWTKFDLEEKYTNFHNCVMIWSSIYKNEIFYKSVLKILSERTNFTSFFQNEFNNEPLPQHGKVLTPHAFITFASVIAQHFDSFWVTSTFGEICYGFYLTPAEKYSSYEKMVMPFDVETWTYLGITFGVAFGVVFVLGFLPRKNYAIVVGSQVQHPGYNILSVFFGIAFKNLPTENSARILLMFFIFFCLIFRTAYQGVLFELTTSDISKKLPTTIEELYEKGYKIIVEVDKFEVDVKVLIDMVPKHQYSTMRGIKTTPGITFNEFRQYFLKHYNNETEKLAFYMDDNAAPTFLFDFKISAPRLEQNVFCTTLGMALTKNHFFYFLLDKIVQDLSSTGIMQKFRRDVYSPDKVSLDRKKPKVLSTQDLEFGFVLWLIALTIPTSCFALEFLSYFFFRKIKFYFVRVVKNFVGIFSFLKVLKDLKLM